MRYKSLFGAITTQRMTIALLACIGLLGLFVPLEAQSGRKVPKKPVNREPAPPPTEEPQEKPSSTQNDSNTITVIVASDLYDITSNSSVLTEIVGDGIMQRLGDVRSVKARSIGDRVNRKEASDAARKSSNTYVLWFQLRSDAGFRSEPNMTTSEYLRLLYVDYAVFSPGTGKQKTMGHVYPRQRVPGGVGIPSPPRTTAWGAEYTLRWAGRETADRLLDTLGLSRPPDIPH